MRPMKLLIRMKKDIKPEKVEDIAIAIVKEENEYKEEVWNVYLVNLKEGNLEGVLVRSNGYGLVDGQKVKTSEIRHFLDELGAKSFKRIENIIPEVFKLANQYWLSFYLDNKMQDKKYTFVAGSIDEMNFVDIPLINKKGVMIK